jgi:hypothetical protein
MWGHGVLLVCTVYSETAVSRKPFGIEHVYIFTFFLLRMTDTMTSQNTDLCSGIFCIHGQQTVLDLNLCTLSVGSSQQRIWTALSSGTGSPGKVSRERTIYTFIVEKGKKPAASTAASHLPCVFPDWLTLQSMKLIVPNWIIILTYATVTLLTIPRNKKFALTATELAGCGQKGQVCGSVHRPTSLLATARGHKTNSHKPEWSPSNIYLPHITTPEIIPVESRKQVDTMGESRLWPSASKKHGT